MSKFKGKFGDALKAAKQPELKQDKSQQNVKETQPPSVEEKPLAPKKGRPKGKRSNPDFEQVTAYVRSLTYRNTKIALLQQEELEDFSELVEQLLCEWLSTQKGNNSKS